MKATEDTKRKAIYRKLKPSRASNPNKMRWWIIMNSKRRKTARPVFRLNEIDLEMLVSASTKGMSR